MGTGILFGFSLLVSLRQRGFNAGSRVADRGAELRDAEKDLASGDSARKYAERLRNREFSQTEAKRLLASRPAGFDDLIRRLETTGELKNLRIPTYIYEKGLPDDHLFRETVSKHYSFATIENDNLVFNECTLETYETGKGKGKEIARIPVSSVRAIKIIDNDATRRARRAGAKIVDKGLGKIVSTMTPGVEPEPTVVRGATLVIQYLNKDGLVFDAMFLVPSGSKLNRSAKSAVELVVELNEGFDQFDKLLDKITDFSLIESSSTLKIGSSIINGVSAISQFKEVLESEESAVKLARCSAEVLAGFTKNEGFRLSYLRESALSPPLDNAPRIQSPL